MAERAKPGALRKQSKAKVDKAVPRKSAPIKRVIFPPIKLHKDKRRRTWSVNVDLPRDVDAQIRRYVEEDELTSWTVMIHSALYVYRWQFWTKKQLDAEFREAIEESFRSAEEEGAIEVTPQFWKNFRKRGERNLKLLQKLKLQGKVGNLLLPKELYEFVLERIDSGECATPTDVLCEALPHLRRQRQKERRRRRPSSEPKVLKTAGNWNV